MSEDAIKDSSAVNVPAVDNVSSAGDYSAISDTGSAEVLQYNIDQSGERVRVRGVVRNNSGEALSPVVITVELLDEGGEVVGKQETFPGGTPDFAMAPGQRAGFNVEFDESVSKCASARISVYTEPAESQDEMPSAYNELQVSDVQLGEGSLNGKVRNTGQQQATDLLVAVVLYDRKSRVVGAGEATTDEETLAPGQETAFTFPYSDPAADTWDVGVSARVAEQSA